MFCRWLLDAYIELERMWKEISRLKAKLKFTNLCGYFIRKLPTAYAVAIKESIRLTERLDYPGRDIYMNLDGSFQRRRLGACKKEPETVEWIETHLRPGDVLYDIGANVGAYSFVAYAVTGGNCKVFAFEPSFTTFSALSHNVFLNGCQDRIIPLSVALGHETKLLAFNYSSIAPGTSFHTLGEPIDEKGMAYQPAFTQPILSYRLDDLVRQFALQPANHIKLDVDGSELNVLCGAEETLTQHNLRSLLVEVDEERYPKGEITSLLFEKGFRIKSKHQRGLSNTLFNYIFVRQIA